MVFQDVVDDLFVSAGHGVVMQRAAFEKTPIVFGFVRVVQGVVWVDETGAVGIAAYWGWWVVMIVQFGGGLEDCVAARTRWLRWCPGR
jgi:hypothetical protein